MVMRRSRSEGARIATGRRRRRRLAIALGSAAAVLIAAAGCGLYVYLSVKHAADRMYEPLPSDRPVYVSRDPEWRQAQEDDGPAAQAAAVQQTPQPDAAADRQASASQQRSVAAQVQTKSKAPGAFTVLLLGVDQRPGDRGRSDTIIVATVNPGSGKALLFNIPRDTRTRLVKRGYDDKINHAYAYDGIAGSVATVENFIDMPIDYYVQVNMEGFETIVDLLGGVDVTNSFAFDIQGAHFPKGSLHLDGAGALKYARMRHDDPRGDIGRNDRQKQVLKQMFRQVTQWDNVVSFSKLLDAASDHVRTNLTFDQMQTMFLKYRTKIKTIESTEIKGRGAMIDSIYYYMVDDAERTRVHDAIKAELSGT